MMARCLNEMNFFWYMRNLISDSNNNYYSIKGILKLFTTNFYDYII